MKLGMVVGLSLGHIVLDGDPAPPKGDTAAKFSAHVRCRQTAGWIKMPLGTQVGLDLGDIVMDSSSSVSPKGGTAAPPLFCSLHD